MSLGSLVLSHEIVQVDCPEEPHIDYIALLVFVVCEPSLKIFALGAPEYQVGIGEFHSDWLLVFVFAPVALYAVDHVDNFELELLLSRVNLLLRAL